MKNGLLRLISMNLSVIIVFVVCVACFQEVSYTVNNNINDKNAAAVTQVVKYETVEIYDESIPNNITKTIVDGEDGLFYINQDGGATTLKEVVNEEVVIGTGKYGVYKGIMTGYGPDCATCNGLGVVACSTKNKKSYNIITDGIYYNDEEFGKVRVLAAALKEFPCGTIVEVDSSNLGKFMGIVMDTGYDMRRFYSMGIYHFDVAYDTEENYMVPYTTNMTGEVVYSVQRWGW